MLDDQNSIALSTRNPFQVTSINQMNILYYTRPLFRARICQLSIRAHKYEWRRRRRLESGMFVPRVHTTIMFYDPRLHTTPTLSSWTPTRFNNETTETKWFIVWLNVYNNRMPNKTYVAEATYMNFSSLTFCKQTIAIEMLTNMFTFV